jgi:hypothetical protein
VCGGHQTSLGCLLAYVSLNCGWLQRVSVSALLLKHGCLDGWGVCRVGLICHMCDSTSGDFPAKNTVYTPCIYMVLTNHGCMPTKEFVMSSASSSLATVCVADSGPLAKNGSLIDEVCANKGSCVWPLQPEAFRQQRVWQTQERWQRMVV